MGSVSCNYVKVSVSFHMKLTSFRGSFASLLAEFHVLSRFHIFSWPRRPAEGQSSKMAADAGGDPGIEVALTVSGWSVLPLVGRFAEPPTCGGRRRKPSPGVYAKKIWPVEVKGQSGQTGRRQQEGTQ